MFEQQITKALEFLKANIRPNLFFPSYISDTRDVNNPVLEVYEYFSTAIIAECLPDTFALKQRILDNYFVTARNNFFTFYSVDIYPPDTDTNALIFSILLLKGYDVHSQANNLMDLIVKYSPKGIAQVWLDEDRKERYDPVVSINAQVLAFLLDREEDLSKNKEYILTHLTSGDYLKGTRYYHSPDAFLFFLVRLALIDNDFFNLIFKDLYKAAQLRKQTTCHPLDMAQRMIVFKAVDIDYTWEMEKLLSLQLGDGSLPADALFHFGGKRGYFGSKAISTAFFIRALNFKLNRL